MFRKNFIIFVILFSLLIIIFFIISKKKSNADYLDIKLSSLKINNDEELVELIKNKMIDLRVPAELIIIPKSVISLDNELIMDNTFTEIFNYVLVFGYENLLKKVLSDENSECLTKKFKNKYSSIKNSKNWPLSLNVNSLNVSYDNKYFTILSLDNEDNTFVYKYNFTINDYYYLDDIEFVSKEMIYDSEGNKIPKPNKEKTNGTTFIYNIFNLCIGENVPEIYIGGNGDWVDSYNVFHKELALTDNYKNKHKFMECLIPEKNYFYVDIAKNKNGKIADFDKRYVQIYVKFDDKDVLYDVNFKLDDNFIDDVEVSTSSIVYKDNSPKSKYEKMYNVHKLTDIEYNGQNVFD